METDKRRMGVPRIEGRHPSPADMMRSVAAQNESFRQYGQFWATRPTRDEREAGQRRLEAALARASRATRRQG